MGAESGFILKNMLLKHAVFGLPFYSKDMSVNRKEYNQIRQREGESKGE